MLLWVQHIQYFYYLRLILPTKGYKEYKTYQQKLELIYLLSHYVDMRNKLLFETYSKEILHHLQLWNAQYLTCFVGVLKQKDSYL